MVVDQIGFEAIKGDGYESDIAVDDMSLSPFGCNGGEITGGRGGDHVPQTSRLHRAPRPRLKVCSDYILSEYLLDVNSMTQLPLPHTTASADQGPFHNDSKQILVLSSVLRIC